MQAHVYYTLLGHVNKSTHDKNRTLQHSRLQTIFIIFFSLFFAISQ